MFSRHKFWASLVTIGVFLPLILKAESQTLDARRAQLKQLLADEWEYELKESPERATSIGDYRNNDRWSDASLVHIQQQKKDMQQWLSKFDAVDTTGFPEQEKLNQRLMVRNLKERIEGIDLKTDEMPVDQFRGAHLQAALFVAVIPFNTTKQYEDYLARLHGIPALFDQVTELMRQGENAPALSPACILLCVSGRLGFVHRAAGKGRWVLPGSLFGLRASRG